MSVKVFCSNVCCKHHTADNGCADKVKIGLRGQCESFEKGFFHYILAVASAMGKSNYIDAICLNDDLRIGLFYILKCYGLGFSECSWGTCRFIQIKDGENGRPLHFAEIIERDINMEEYSKLYSDLMKGILPSPAKKPACSRGEKAELGYGWLSPAGEFMESPFGSHEESAERICESKGWRDEFFEWQRNKEDGLCLLRDFLAEVKGYCLIHNPAGVGGYLVTQVKPLTKQQREFLYGYFADKGDRFMAEQYLDDRSA